VASATISTPGAETYSFDTTKTDVVTVAAAFAPGAPPRNRASQSSGWAPRTHFYTSRFVTQDWGDEQLCKCERGTYFRR